MSDDDDQQARNEADQRTLIALSALVLVAVLLLGLIAIVVPGLLGVILVVGGMLIFGTGHYVLWGWWLPRFLKRYEKDDDPDR